MADRREEIIEAGIEIFSAKGYYNTHIADIVELVGIAKGTFYLYFKSKKELFVALIKKDLKKYLLMYLKQKNLKMII